MTKVYKTARGKMIDIDKVKLSNESVVAVGNMRVNARGDLLGAGSQIAASRNQVMDQVYAVNEGGGYSPNDPENFIEGGNQLEASNAQDLNDLVSNTIVTIEDTTETSAKPAARGSLADSIAKQTTVTQEPLLTPSQQKKSNGPSRI